MSTDIDEEIEALEAMKFVGSYSPGSMVARGTMMPEAGEGIGSVSPRGTVQARKTKRVLDSMVTVMMIRGDGLWAL
jgi:hypothetical protein